MEKKYTFEQLEESYNSTLSICFTYLDKAVKELNSLSVEKTDKELSEEKKQKLMWLHTAIAIGLDVVHRAYPLCFDIFPDNKENLENAFAMFQRFEKAGLLKPCNCDYCKEMKHVEEKVDQSSDSVD